MCQSVSQLETLDGQSKATTIKNNCDSTVYIGAPNDIETANEMSLKLNRPTAEMLALKPDQAIVCRRGCAPVIAHRYRTLEDPEYTAVTEKFARVRTSAVLPERRKRKDFSPLQGARESLDDFAKEVDQLAAKLDKRYKSLLGGSGQTG
jgi:type IV secretory pathway TraG/TraD family ATPase VirD4